MSILDDAIREHLALKRAHGADEAELKKLEDEAFGPPQRPDDVDPFAEAPTEFLTTPEGGEAAPEGARRMPNIADLQEPPPPSAPTPEERADQAAEATGAGDDAQTAEAPQAEAPAVEEQTAMEHEAISEPPDEPIGPTPPVEPVAEEPPPPAPPAEPVAETGPNTEERHAIADQPTQFFDVEAEMAEDTATAPPPPEPPVEEEDEEDEEFWSDQRLSDELDQALEAPVTEEHEIAPAPPAPESPGPAPPAPPEQPSEELELEQATELEGGEHEAVEDHVTDEDDRDADLPQGARPQSEEDDDAPPPSYESRAGHDDVLEDTPEFLEDAPEDDELWFEQKPPKDFDFDD